MKYSVFLHIQKRIERIGNSLFATSRRKKIGAKDNFTVISNNCWAGNVYRYFGLPYSTPTVGLYFFAEDYLKFVSNLPKYLNEKLCFISFTQSKYYYEIINKGQMKCPIGKLDDIEVVFLHYKSEQEAREKWERRCARVNYDNLIVKFSYMNCCTDRIAEQFDCLPYPKKIMFVRTKEEEKRYSNSGVYYHGFEDAPQITNDTDRFNWYVDLIKLIGQEPDNKKG